jgi:hypothetical protein
MTTDRKDPVAGRKDPIPDRMVPYWGRTHSSAESR